MWHKYKISYVRSVAKDIEKIPYQTMARIFEKIEALANDTSGLDIKKLKWHTDDTYRLRVWDYRIIYRKKNEELIILVLEIGHRKEIYL